jgi:hypothetical protein
MSSSGSETASTLYEAEKSTISDNACTLNAKKVNPAVASIPESHPAGHKHHNKYDRIVRCSDCHLYTTIWVPKVSLKALRLGQTRSQWCPVGHHFSLVKRVKIGDLTMKEMEAASKVHDIRVL